MKFQPNYMSIPDIAVVKFRSIDYEEHYKKKQLDQMLAKVDLSFKKMREEHQKILDKKKTPKPYSTYLSDFLKRVENILYSKAVQNMKECLTLFVLVSILYLALTGKLYIKG